MITVYYPNNFQEERKYIIDFFFMECLGLNYKSYSHVGLDYKIVLENKSILIIQDSFFSSQGHDNYLKLDNIPLVVEYEINPFIVEDNIPILYGTEIFEVTKDNIICGIDIFSSSFFMLTRWEEYVNKERDMHNRFPATASVAYKNGFLDRPIVNEYLEMLWNMLKYLGIEQSRKKREFQFINTHDVDHIKKWNSKSQIIKSIGGDVLKRKSPVLALDRVKEYTKIKFNKIKDPYDTFDWLMDLSEEANIKSQFYFMSGGVTKFDNNYSIKEKKSLEIINKVFQRGHSVGFHPSYNAFNNYEQWKKEKELLESTIGKSVTEGRQHYLRFEAPLTWQIWDDNGMERDYTLSYADKEGFRCGTCYEFPVFNFLTRKRLALIESPLIVMEGSFTTYQDIEPKYMLNKTKQLLNKVKKYDGEFVYLWHNSSFNTMEWEKFSFVYKEIIGCNNSEV